MKLSFTLYAEDFGPLTTTGNNSTGKAQVRTATTDLYLYLTADDALRLSQLFAGLADNIRSLDDGVAA